MPSKLTEGLIPNIDACKTGAGLSRGPNLRKKLVASAWSQTWPAPDATLDLDFINNRGYVFGQGQGGVMDAISFTRASSGAYVGSDGLLKNGGGLGKNLLSFPQDFNNAAWTKTNVTVTADANVAPDGTTTADSLFETATTGIHSINQIVTTVAGSPYTFSVYAKTNGNDFLQIVPPASVVTSAYANFNITTGVVGTFSGTGLTSSISGPVNGFYRCVVSVASAASSSTTSTPTLCIVTAANSSRLPSYAGDITKGIFIWGAQFEVSSTETQYFPTNVNQPRFDWASLAQTAQVNKQIFSDTALANFGTITTTTSPIMGSNFFNIYTPNSPIITSTIVGATPYSSFTPSTTAPTYNISVYVNTAGQRYIYFYTNGSGIQPNVGISFKYDTQTSTTTELFSGNANNTGLVVQNISVNLYRVSVTTTFNALGNPKMPGVFCTNENSTYSSNCYSIGFTQNAQAFTVGAWQLQTIATLASYQAVGIAIPTNTPLAPTPTSNGILIEEQRTNLLLWSRDATQTAWTKTNTTATLNQTGIDGVANSATLLTATAANATCIQTTTAASTAKTISIFLKAITVTGAIQVSIDGSTWSTVDLSNGLWNRITLTAALANPVLGILIQNASDSIAFDYAQIEAASFATTPIYTSSATATRAGDSGTVSTLLYPWYSNSGGTFSIEGYNIGASGSNRFAIYLNGAGSATGRIFGYGSNGFIRPVMSAADFNGNYNITSDSLTTGSFLFKEIFSFTNGLATVAVNGVFHSSVELYNVVMPTTIVGLVIQGDLQSFYLKDISYTQAVYTSLAARNFSQLGITT